MDNLRRTRRNALDSANATEDSVIGTRFDKRGRTRPFLIYTQSGRRRDGQGGMCETKVRRTVCGRRIPLPVP